MRGCGSIVAEHVATQASLARLSMKALTAAEMREVDRRTTERLGISGAELMERAGKHVADAVLRRFPKSRPCVAILCGKGNNGGDGLVAARHLKLAGLQPQVYLFGEASAMTGDAAQNLKRWREGGGTVINIDGEASREKNSANISRSHVIVDALLGTGLRGGASGTIARTITEINLLSRGATAVRPGLILAVDTPSGLHSDVQPTEGPVLRAHQTITFTAPKVGQLILPDSDAIGALQVCAIGSPAALVEELGRGDLRWLEPEEFAALPLVRAADSNKGTYGHVLLVAGSVGKTGAAVLAGRAALRGGAGLVTVATPRAGWSAVANGQAEYMTEPLPETEMGTISMKALEGGKFEKIEKGKTVLALGPGLGVAGETQECIRAIVKGTTLPVILDADGLNAYTGRGDALRDRKTKYLAITPHPGEMARLLDCTIRDVQRERLKIALEGARRWNVYVVLKGFHTIIAAPDGQVFVNTTGNAGLAKGGTGDVLTGLLAALTAQFIATDWVRVLALGVYLHGQAAEIATEEKDDSGIVAGDIVEMLSRARLRLRRELGGEQQSGV
ncbi:MAG: NAD(P)H-hydrate dehydratase [Candidatus Acidiferrum sp.]